MEAETIPITGFKWNAFSKSLNFAIAFVSSIFLARILSPKEFGTMAIIFPLIGLLELILDSGFHNSLIQNDNIEEVDYHTVFWLQSFLGLIIFVILFFTAPFIANFYDLPILSTIIKIISVSIFLNGISIIHLARLKKNLNFKALAYIDIMSLILSSIIGILMALKDYGVYSLVIQQVSFRLFTTTFAYYYIQWHPKFIFKRLSVIKLSKFALLQLFNKLIELVTTRIDLIMLGAVLPETKLGLYQRAKNLNQLPATFSGSIIGSTLFPQFSKYQNDKEGIYKLYLKYNFILGLLFIPLFCFLYIISKDLIILLFSAKWIDAVPYFKLFCIGGFLWPIIALKVNIINSQARADIILKWNIIFSAIKILISLIIMTYVPKVLPEHFIMLYVVSLYIEYFVYLNFVNQLLSNKNLISLKKLFIPIGITVICFIISSIINSNIIIEKTIISIIFQSTIFWSIWGVIIFLLIKVSIINRSELSIE